MAESIDRTEVFDDPTTKKTVLAGMFRNCYLEYASYVILERAVPNIDDGLKPVQRRILHAMQTVDDGRFNKVANIVGTTMQYHPHGDASIGDALVQLGQKELLIETQGNWGNILTGDSAAAPRYIEAMLSEFALETVFSPKITEWVPSYDGRKKEPVTLPVKFPLLLAQGVEGIAVGLSSKILPHNFNEILEAAVSYLEGEDFQLYPDFQTGGLLDVSRYNDGMRGGSVKVRARIEKLDNKTLAITELPFGKTTSSLITSILAANDKGKIKIRKVDDNTSAEPEILVHLMPGTSSDKAIDALYAFTDCEISISPNCCVIRDKKPEFLSVKDLLRHSLDRTRLLLNKELEIRYNEIREEIFFDTLEKIFIEQRIYKDREIEEAADMDTALMHLDKRLEPFKESLYREPTRDDLLKLWEIKMGRILKFNSERAEKHIQDLTSKAEKIKEDIDNIDRYTADWFRHLKDKYGENFQRRTVLRNFDSIEASKVAEANKRLYYDKEGGFIGTSLKENEFKFTCSDLDDILLIYKNGTYKIVKTPEKLYVGKDIEYIGLFKKGDKRTIYNVVYQNGKPGDIDQDGKPLGASYKKRFYITGLTRDKEYNLTKGYPGSTIIYFSANPNGEAESVELTLRNKDKKGIDKKISVNFAELDIKGKESLGNLVTKQPLRTGSSNYKVIEKGKSTLGGRDVWFDRDVLRLNYEGRGEKLGNFQGEDKVLVLTDKGEFYTTSYSDSNHYDDNIMLIEKFDPDKEWTLILGSKEKGFPRLKRFKFEISATPQSFKQPFDNSKVLLLTSDPLPVFKLTFGDKDSARLPEIVDASEFIKVKGYSTKGKALSGYTVDNVEQIACGIPPKSEEEKVSSETDSDINDDKIPASEKEHPEIIMGNLFDDEEV